MMHVFFLTDGQKQLLLHSMSPGEPRGSRQFTHDHVGSLGEIDTFGVLCSLLREVSTSRIRTFDGHADLVANGGSFGLQRTQ